MVLRSPESLSVRTRLCQLGIDPRDDSPDHQGTHEAATEPRHITAKATPRPAPARAIRPKTVAEKQFCALGEGAHAFIAGAAAAGHTRLGPELAELNTLAAAHGTQAFTAALERAVAFRRFKAADVRSILAAGAGTPHPRRAGDALIIDLPTSTGRSLTEYAPTNHAEGEADSPGTGIATGAGRVVSS